jgi:hypothetical protein
MTADGYGLDKALDVLNKEAVLGQLCQVIVGVRRVNADRQEPTLGDDNFSLAALNWRNISNQAERLFDGKTTVKALRPKNSFQLVARGYTINAYALSSTDPYAIRWNASGLKLGLADANSAHAGDLGYEVLTLDDALFDDGQSDDAGIHANHVFLVHWADVEGRTVRIWAGLPRNNTKGGAPWLELVELSGHGGTGGSTQPAPVEPNSDTATGFKASVVPDVPIEWAPAQEPDTGTDAAPGA